MNIKAILSTFLLCFGLIKFESVQGWTSSGHIAVAEIAYEQLHPHAKQKSDELISILAPFYPESDTFVKAATWLDIINLHDFKILWKWHFTTIPYDPEGILTESDRELIDAINADADILYGLEHAIKTLKSQKANLFEKALMLRYLIHAVADAHQPLHTTSLYDSHFPHGDLGGNLFTINSPLAKNLHLLWDLGLGSIPETEMQETVSEEVLQEIQSFAKYLTFTYPKDRFSGSIHVSKERWIREAHDLATSTAYTLHLGAVPSEEYLKNGRALCERQMALAGYRLGELLNEIFE
jgi:S1/P1 Nuclease